MQSVLIVDDNQPWCDVLKRRLELETGYDPIYVAYDGAKAISMIEICRPDIIILDFALPVYDGVFITRHIREVLIDYDPIIYILSGAATDVTVDSFKRLRVDFITLKPTDPISVMHNLRFIVDQRYLIEKAYSAPKIDMDSVVEDILFHLGINMSKISGKQTADALLISLERRDYMQGLTTKLYPAVAEINDTTAKAVERNIRYSISTMVGKNTALFQEIFRGYPSSGKKIKNNEFLSAVVHHIQTRVRGLVY